MTPEERDRMNQLCLRIQEERDYEKFAGLLQEMSELIDRKSRRRFKQYPKLIWYRSRPWKTLPAVVKKLLQPVHPDQHQKVEISISEADHLYREIRFENLLIDTDGLPVALKNGAHLDVTFEAEHADTVKITNPAV
jgi:hypothetical protein